MRLTRETLEDPRFWYLVLTNLEDARKEAELEVRRERLERAACKARREGDWQRENRYFAAADCITYMIQEGDF